MAPRICEQICLLIAGLVAIQKDFLGVTKWVHSAVDDDSIVKICEISSLRKKNKRLDNIYNWGAQENQGTAQN